MLLVFKIKKENEVAGLTQSEEISLTRESFDKLRKALVFTHSHAFSPM